jgi:hypothetical protein
MKDILKQRTSDARRLKIGHDGNMGYPLFSLRSQRKMLKKKSPINRGIRPNKVCWETDPTTFSMAKNDKTSLVLGREPRGRP